MKLISSIHKYDIVIFNKINDKAISSSLIRISRWLSRTGDGYLYVLLALWDYWCNQLISPLFTTIVWAFLLERPIYWLLKNSLKRNRPQQALTNFQSVITPSDQFSFPSGHTSAAFMMATLVGYFYPAFMIPLYLWAAGVGLSRVILGVHFPTDILVGIILGVSLAISTLSLTSA